MDNCTLGIDRTIVGKTGDYPHDPIASRNLEDDSLRVESMKHYDRCTDPDCPVRFAYCDPFPETEHWHFTGSTDHPATPDPPSDGSDLFDRWPRA